MTYSHFLFGVRIVILFVDKFTYYGTELEEFPDSPLISGLL